jgi:hypothetical protein
MKKNIIYAENQRKVNEERDAESWQDSILLDLQSDLLILQYSF